MQKIKTYFDQIPVEEVKRIAEIEQQDETNGMARGASKKKLNENILEMNRLKPERPKNMTHSFEISMLEAGRIKCTQKN